jgi:hypothetical protein
MRKPISLAIAVLVAVGCSRENKYRAEANPSNFPPPSSGGRTWVFHASPLFAQDSARELRSSVNDALKHVGLPPVGSDGVNVGGYSEGVGEGHFVWSNFEWKDYTEGRLSVRTGAHYNEQPKGKIIFMCLETKK